VAKLASVRVALEIGKARTFASALDWPGWSRVGKSEALALAALAEYRDRYSIAIQRAGYTPPIVTVDSFDVVERLPGSASTEFGAPGGQAEADRAPVGADEARMHAAILAAAWMTFDEVVASAPLDLRKGPRGGGRDRDGVVEHTLGADTAYARRLGIRHRQPAATDRDAVVALRETMLAVIGTPSDGNPVVEKGWPLRFAARYITWHTLDHAWEIQDRSAPAE
jgi:hypothetical protein